MTTPSSTSTRSIRQADFTLERSYTASPARVFDAFADKASKEAWFQGPPQWLRKRHEMDFRVGGRESSLVGPPEGPDHGFEAIYHDIQPDERIVYSYEMYLDDARTSASLAIIEFFAEGGGTRIVITEHGAFLDGYDKPGEREHGTKLLLDAIGSFVDAD
jgi:uncharacterized protein YndB with AHSA1/START domain